MGGPGATGKLRRRRHRAHGMTVILDAGGVSALAGQRARLVELRRRGYWPAQVPAVVLTEALTGSIVATFTPTGCSGPVRYGKWTSRRHVRVRGCARAQAGLARSRRPTRSSQPSRAPCPTQSCSPATRRILTQWPSTPHGRSPSQGSSPWLLNRATEDHILTIRKFGARRWYQYGPDGALNSRDRRGIYDHPRPEHDNGVRIVLTGLRKQERPLRRSRSPLTDRRRRDGQGRKPGQQ